MGLWELVLTLSVLIVIMKLSSGCFLYCNCNQLCWYLCLELESFLL